MTVYIELVFFENFVIDYFLLLSGSKISYIRAKHPVIASLFGALYAVIMPLFYNTNFLQTTVVLALMCYLCFMPKNFKVFIYSLIAVSACSGALFGITNLFFTPSAGIFYEDNIFFIVSLTSTFFSVALYRSLIPFMRKKNIEDNRAVINLCGKSFSAFIDSGNGLYYKDIPVILINSALVNIPEKPLIIPYSTVEKEGALLGFIPDSISVTYMNKNYSPKCVVAMCDNDFHKKFDALLHPDLLKECI